MPKLEQFDKRVLAKIPEELKSYIKDLEVMFDDLERRYALSDHLITPTGLDIHLARDGQSIMIHGLRERAIRLDHRALHKLIEHGDEILGFLSRHQFVPENGNGREKSKPRRARK